MSETVVSIDTGTDTLLCTIEQRVATITLNRPEARNALSDELTPALRTQLAAMGDDDRVGAIVLTGTGTAFCAGGDVKGFAADTGGGDKKPSGTPPSLETRIQGFCFHLCNIFCHL